MESTLEFVVRRLAAMEPKFRGEIWDNCARFRLVGSGYKALYENYPEQDGHFNIATARHLAGPLRALRHPDVRKVFIIGAVQCLKSIAGDVWIPYLMEHEPRATLVLFEDDPKAKLYCASRLMDTLYAHPVLKQQIAEIDRHDATNTKIKLASMVLQVAGLNDGNVSSLSWPNIWISEAWQHQNDGLLVKAIKRADRFPDTCKILIESQPGLAGEDLHREAGAAHPVHLTWACPFCGGRQTWETPNEFGRLRPDEFTPLPVLQYPPGELPLPNPPAPGTYSGMKWGAAERLVDGTLQAVSITERARSAWWECYHCGTPIQDTPDNRQAIMDSYEQDFRIRLDDGTWYVPPAVAFYLPFESARDNRFAKTVATYLTAKDAKRLGDDVPLRDWYLQERAVFYSPTLTKVTMPVVARSERIEGMIPDEVCRVLGVDAQQDDSLTALTGRPTTGHFWVDARAIDKWGNIEQLDRGYVTSWDELIAFQDRLNISNENVGIDASFYTSDIIDMAAQKIRPYVRRFKKHGKWREDQVWHTWTLLKGDDRNGWKHPDGRWRAYSPMQPVERMTTLKGQQVRIKIPIYLWSNLLVKDQLSTLLTGGEGRVRFNSLKRNQLTESARLKEVGELTYENQMSAEEKVTGRNGKPKWEKIPGRRHNHYWDAACMTLVLFGLGGHLGVAAVADGEVAA